MTEVVGQRLMQRFARRFDVMVVSVVITLGLSVIQAPLTCIALTFDDGPDSVTTPKVLDTLAHFRAHATFFVIGNRVAAHRNLLQHLYDTGNEIGNHTWSHPDLTRLSSAQIRDQINSTQDAITNLGFPAPRYFRPPYEARNDLVRRVVNMPFILWNVDPKDWHQNDPNVLAQLVISQVQPGSIVILHDTKSVTTQALPQILERLQGQYHFVTITELLNLPPDAKGEFFKR
ncbi:polysaccharide deacetylase family protein [Candidatus Saccharibacteria bacterium]|nr:polysaccharide deacetylase family protein [Candidatus Saccharibacteria bacterium]